MVQQVWQHSPVRGLDRLVLLGLADYANEKHGGEAWPSAQTLADDLDLPLRTVQRSLQRLRDNGDIIPVKGMKGGRNTTVRYRFLVRLVVDNTVPNPATEAGLDSETPPDVRVAPPNRAVNPATLAEELREEPSKDPWDGHWSDRNKSKCPDGYPTRRECPLCRRDDERWGPQSAPGKWTDRRGA